MDWKATFFFSCKRNSLNQLEAHEKCHSSRYWFLIYGIFGKNLSKQGNMVCFPDTYLSSPLPIVSLWHLIIVSFVINLKELGFCFDLFWNFSVVNISSQANQTNISPSEDKSGSQNAPSSGNFINFYFFRVHLSLETIGDIIMSQSNRSFNIPRYLTPLPSGGGGNLIIRVFQGVGNLNCTLDLKWNLWCGELSWGTWH